MTWWGRMLRPFRDWLRRFFGHWTLRRKVVVTVVTLVAFLGVLIGGVSVAFMHSYLVGRLDDQLRLASARAQTVVVNGLHTYGSLPSARDIVNYTGQPVGTCAFIIRGTRVVDYAYLVENRGSRVAPPSLPRSFELSVDTGPQTLDIGGSFHDYRFTAVTLADGSVLAIGLPLQEVEASTGRLAVIVAIATFGAGLAALALGLVIVRVALRPLERVAATAAEVSQLPLERGEVALAVRVPEEDTDPRTEVGRVGSAFNSMLGHVASALSVREASERKVRQFVSDASHELRTPLASIRGYAELTRRSPKRLPDDAQHSLERIESEAVRMTGIVEDLLLLARLDEGREIEHESVDLTMLLVDLVSDAHAAGPDHVWNLELPDEPIEIVGDRAKLHQVFANLLANARVHTPEGTTVTVSLATAGDTALVTVSDDGPGIPEELQPRLFERFARGDSSRSRATGSTGLGLAIVKAVVDAHGGSIEVESTPGSTVFRVQLPVGERR